MFRTIRRYSNCFLSPVVRDGMDGNGLKLEKNSRRSVCQGAAQKTERENIKKSAARGSLLLPLAALFFIFFHALFFFFFFCDAP